MLKYDYYKSLNGKCPTELYKDFRERQILEEKLNELESDKGSSFTLSSVILICCLAVPLIIGCYNLLKNIDNQFIWYLISLVLFCMFGAFFYYVLDHYKEKRKIKNRKVLEPLYIEYFEQSDRIKKYENFVSDCEDFISNLELSESQMREFYTAKHNCYK